MKFTRTLYTWMAAGALLLSACEPLEETNQNPNEPANVSAGVLFTEGVRAGVNTSVNQSFLLGNNAAQLTAKSLRTEVDAYSWNSFSNVWSGYYESLANVVESERVATEEGNAKMQGAAKVMKSWMFSQLTLAYGDIPYSEALTGSTDANWFPAYDSQEEIITGTGGLLDELEQAVVLLGGTGAVEGDILFDGDASKWVKFANALRLRLLMYSSGQQDASAEFAAIVASESLMESNDDNAALTYTGNYPNEYPLVPMKQGDFDAVYLSNNAYNALTTLDDPRLYRFARPVNADAVNADPMVAAVYDGCDNGLETGSCDKSGSRLGYAYYNYPSHAQAAVQAEGLLMTYAEMAFLLAEAAHKGWITDDAATWYNEGVAASMEYYGADFANTAWADLSAYLAGTAAYDAADINTIRQQKWLAMFFSGLDPYFELRRWYVEESGDWTALGFVSAPCQNTNGDALPMRFLYPGNEESLNPDNYQSAVTALGGNTQNATMWVVD